MELSRTSSDNSVLGELALNVQAEDRVGARAGLVVKSRPYMSRLRALVQYVHCLLTAANILLSQALYIYSFSGVLSQLQIVIVLIE